MTWCGGGRLPRSEFFLALGTARPWPWNTGTLPPHTVLHVAVRLLCSAHTPHFKLGNGQGNLHGAVMVICFMTHCSSISLTRSPLQVPSNSEGVWRATATSSQLSAWQAPPLNNNNSTTQQGRNQSHINQLNSKRSRVTLPRRIKTSQQTS